MLSVASEPCCSMLCGFRCLVCLSRAAGTHCTYPECRTVVELSKLSHRPVDPSIPSCKPSRKVVTDSTTQTVFIGPVLMLRMVLGVNYDLFVVSAAYVTCMSICCAHSPCHPYVYFLVFTDYVTCTCVFLCSQTISPVCNPHLYFLVSIDHVSVCMCSCFYSPCNLYVCFLVFIAHAFLVLVAM